MTNVLETVKKDKFIFFNSNKAQFIHSNIVIYIFEESLKSNPLTG